MDNNSSQTVTMHGNPMTLSGPIPHVGDPAPDFTALSNDLQPVRLSEFAGRIVIISAVPSLDTPVCDLQTRRFNTEAGQLGENVQILTVSMDLPFAQKRWCGAAGIAHLMTLSDHRTAEFGQTYGILISELRLLARAVFVVDAKGVLRHMEVVPEIAQEPDYGAALAAVKALIAQ
jgi:thiol peroxidase